MSSSVVAEWEEKASKAKKLHRPSLKNWACDGFYHKKFPAFVRSIEHRDSQFEQFAPKVNGNVNVKPATASTSDVDVDVNVAELSSCTHFHPSVPVVVDASTMTPTEFHSKIEAKRLPSVIRQIPTQDPGHRHAELSTSSTNANVNEHEHTSTHTKPWEALEKWTLDALGDASCELRERSFKCGEDDDENSIRMRLKYFLQYTKYNHDDSPLYIFDTRFDEDRVAKQLLSHYKVPSYFDEDLFKLVGEKRRPPYRWWLIGPERSGTTVHIDPLATSAWNTLIVGRKRWVLFPPHLPKGVVKGRGLVRGNEDDESVHYFTTILPRIKQKALDVERLRHKHKQQQKGGGGSVTTTTLLTDKEQQLLERYENFTCFEFTQSAGETVYIPNGWWHAVINLTHTVGITQNFCSSRNFEEVWISTRTGRKKMAYKWLLELETHYPHLAARAKELNDKDDFVMKYDPVQVEKRRQLERQRRKEKRHNKKKKKTLEKEKKHLNNNERTPYYSGGGHREPEPKRSRTVSPVSTELQEEK
jgi:histone arginine demethylase JMJD6